MRILNSAVSLLRQGAHSLLVRRAFKRSVGPAKGFRLYPGPSGVMMLDALGFGRLVKPTAEYLFLENLPAIPGGVVYDIGGFIGELTLAFARKVGSTGTVVTFEPNPLNQEAIRRNLNLNSTCPVTLIPAGVGSGPATLELVFQAGSTATGSLSPDIQSALKQIPVQRCTVQVDSLDHWVQAYSLPLPNLVKIDVEGLEQAVLSGMEGTVAASSPALYIELHGVGRPAKQRNAEAVVCWLQQHGYSVFHVESARVVTTPLPSDVFSGHLYATKAP